MNAVLSLCQHVRKNPVLFWGFPDLPLKRVTCCGRRGPAACALSGRLCRSRAGRPVRPFRGSRRPETESRLRGEEGKSRSPPEGLARPLAAGDSEAQALQGRARPRRARCPPRSRPKSYRLRQQEQPLAGAQERPGGEKEASPRRRLGIGALGSLHRVAAKGSLAGGEAAPAPRDEPRPLALRKRNASCARGSGAGRGNGALRGPERRGGLPAGPPAGCGATPPQRMPQGLAPRRRPAPSR